MAVGMAATIRIGFRVGAGEIAGGRTTAFIAVVTSGAIAIFGAILIYFLRQDMVNIYTTEFAVSSLAATLLMFVVFFLFFDAAQSTFTGALRGYKDTRIPMWIALFSFWVIGLPIGITFGFGFVGDLEGVYGFWLGLAMGVGIASFLLAYRLWRVSGDLGLIKKLSVEAEKQTINR